MNPQIAFAQALLNPALPCPGGLCTWNGSAPSARFAVYRNNVMVSLVDALADTYPVLQQLVGEAFFRAMAREFAQSHPPRSAVMAGYGAGFAEFVAIFAPAASVPYLADVARLEMAQVVAYHSADLPALQARTLQEALAQPERLASLRLVLHPSVHIIRSAFAIYSIWAAHRQEQSMSLVDTQVAQDVLVYRAGLQVCTLELGGGTAEFVLALQAGQTLLHAAASAGQASPGFDLSQALALLLRWELITQAHTNDTPHDHTD